MTETLFGRMTACFNAHRSIYWPNLSRLTGLLIVGNFSLFFLTGLVIQHGYYYTHISLVLLGAVEVGLLLPLGLFDRFWYYCLLLVFELAAVYFFLVSIWYWVTTSAL